MIVSPASRLIRITASIAIVFALLSVFLWLIPLVEPDGTERTGIQGEGDDLTTERDGNMAERVIKTDEEWQEQLTPEQYRITRQKGTEPPFSGEYYNFHGKGIYRCVCCGAELFRSETKFESGSGWPSFYEPVSRDRIAEETDNSLGMRRVEIECARCGAHLGHVFDDGPEPTGLRYCINSASLRFEGDGKAK